MSMFKTRRARAAGHGDTRRPVSELHTDEIEGVTLDAFAEFIARVGQPSVSSAEHEAIAVQLGFPDGRYDLIRNAWLARVYSSPALGKRFGHALDEARDRL